MDENMNSLNDLVSISKSFKFRDNEESVFDKTRIMGYCKENDETLLIYIEGWNESEELQYHNEEDSTVEINKDIKMLNEYFDV